MGNLAVTCATLNKSFDEIKRFSSAKIISLVFPNTLGKKA